MQLLLYPKHRIMRSAVLWLCLLAATSPLLAQQEPIQQTAETLASKPDFSTLKPPTTNESAGQETTQTEAAAKLEQLVLIQTVLDSKLSERRELGDKIASANEQDQADLRRAANILTTEITKLRDTLENIATGGVDKNLFEEKTTQDKKDWREDVSLIAQPVLDSLKEITEKPRRIKELNELVELKNDEMKVSSDALKQLSTVTVQNGSGPLQGSIQNLTNKWQKRRDDARSAIDIAQIQLQGLQGDQPLSTTIYSALIKFAQGRGLTILLAIGAAWLVWISVRMLLKTYQHTLLDKREPDSRTRYRVAKYSIQAFTFSLILIAVFIVFYERHDVLLLGLLILLIVGFVLNAKQLLPRYVKEARLLLNLGAMREGERVIYNDLPYRVESINMYTVFRNPELSGILRIPLAELTTISSRPVTQDSWFPTSTGDIVLTDDKRLFKVENQNPDTVELKRRGGEVMTIPSAHFYAMSMINLSRFGTFGVNGQFGVDYDHQPISASIIPAALRDGINAAIQASNLGQSLKEVRVELAEAGDSSLNYWIFVTMDSAAAFSHNRVRRIMQSACIETCSQRGWSIPFPHVSLVKKPDLDGVSDQPPPPLRATG